LLGAGRIGTMHGPLLRSLDGVDEMLIGDADGTRAEQLAGSLERAQAKDPDTVIGTCDALIITAASDAHAPLVRSALPRGIPIFCEKPLASTLQDTIALAREIEDSGVPFQLGFQRRFDAGYREARRMLQSGELGTLYAVRLAGHDPAPPHESYIRASGGLFRDFSVHDFDVIRWLTGLEVDEVYADGAVRGFPVFAKYDDVDTAVATLRMAGGPLVAMTVSRHDPLGYDIRAELFGSRDSVSVGLGPHTPMHSLEPGVPPPAGPAWSGFPVRFAQAYRDELTGFIALASGKVATSPCTARDGVEALRIAEAATRSMHEHRPVRLAEIEG
jgi:myo-inositol 2-dehydrogenase/D-chiro-inositol 1-dehydrogenase